MSKSYMKWLEENKRNHPEAWKNAVKTAKNQSKRRRIFNREKNKRALWKHGIRNLGPSIL